MCSNNSKAENDERQHEGKSDDGGEKKRKRTWRNDFFRSSTLTFDCLCFSPEWQECPEEEHRKRRETERGFHMHISLSGMLFKNSSSKHIIYILITLSTVAFKIAGYQRFWLQSTCYGICRLRHQSIKNKSHVHLRHGDKKKQHLYYTVYA